MLQMFCILQISPGFPLGVRILKQSGLPLAATYCTDS